MPSLGRVKDDLDGRVNDYSLVDVETYLHPPLTAGLFVLALFAGVGFRESGARSAASRALLHVLRAMAIPLVGIGVVYFAVSTITHFSITSSPDEYPYYEGLAAAHAVFASVLTGTFSVPRNLLPPQACAWTGPRQEDSTGRHASSDRRLRASSPGTGS